MATLKNKTQFRVGTILYAVDFAEIQEYTITKLEVLSNKVIVADAERVAEGRVYFDKQIQVVIFNSASTDVCALLEQHAQYTTPSIYINKKDAEGKRERQHTRKMREMLGESVASVIYQIKQL